jgi:CRISPR-associated exonuclease Cas4
MHFSDWAGILALAFFLLALFLLYLAAKQHRNLGLPGGRVGYRDTRAWGVVEKPLFDPQSGLTGKPDYLVEQNGRLIPVEVKTGRTPPAPYDSHIFQAAAYCLLVEQTTGKRPPYGLIHYPDQDFAVDYTPALEAALRTLLVEMREAGRLREVHRSHKDLRRCRACGFRQTCDERLG